MWAFVLQRGILAVVAACLSVMAGVAARDPRREGAEIIGKDLKSRVREMCFPKRMPATFIAGILAEQSYNDCLEDKFRAELHCPRITRGANATKHSAGHVCTRKRREICVIEDIEHFPTELQRFRFTESN